MKPLNLKERPVNQRAGEDDHRNVLQFLLGLNFRQDLATFLICGGNAILSNARLV